MTSRKVFGGSTSSVMLTLEATRRTAAHISKLRKHSCGRRPFSIIKRGDDVDVLTAVPAVQGRQGACDVSSARHPPKSDSGGAESPQTFPQRRATGVHPYSDKSSNAELSTDLATRAAANRSSKKAFGGSFLLGGCRFC